MTYLEIHEKQRTAGPAGIHGNEAVMRDHLRGWEARLEHLPLTELIQNLATITRLGVVAPGRAATRMVVDRLRDPDRIREARLHPIALLAALRTYSWGGGLRGKSVWEPVADVIDALHAAFHEAFGNVQPTDKRLLIALDVSGSMSSGAIAGAPGLTPRDASAAMALVTVATEPRHEVVGFFAGEGGLHLGPSRWPTRANGITPLAIDPGQRLDDAIRFVSDLPFGGTDCALPMLYAIEREREVDTFVIFTDSDTSLGDIHPAQALRMYREKSGIDARLIVVGMVSNGFSIADPSDPGMLDVVGFDAQTPALIAGFVLATCG